MLIAERQSLLSGEISHCETKAQIAHVMDNLARAFGFKYYALIASAGANDTLLAPLLLESSYPPQFVREYDRNQFMRECPMGPRFVDSIVPLCWRLNDPNPALNFNASLAMIDLFRRHGMVTGVVFTMNSVDLSRYALCFQGDRSLLPQQDLNELNMLATYAFDVFDRMRRTELVTPNMLSARELEVVRWTAQGKTSIEIGQILSLSDHTINAYMNNAIRKLDCVNRTQLVAKAIRLKLIS